MVTQASLEVSAGNASGIDMTRKKIVKRCLFLRGIERSPRLSSLENVPIRFFLNRIMKACVVRIENKDLPTRIFRPEQYLSLDAIIVFEIVEPLHMREDHHD
jgi:hypothetical protein